MFFTIIRLTNLTDHHLSSTDCDAMIICDRMYLGVLHYVIFTIIDDILMNPFIAILHHSDTLQWS